MYRIIVEREARDNLVRHYRNLKARNPGSSYAEAWYYGIRDAIEALAASADRCGLAYEDRFFAQTIRQRLHDSYKILFTVRGDRVHVLHIRHQTEDPADLTGGAKD